MISTSCCIYPLKILYVNIFAIKIKITIWRMADCINPQPDTMPVSRKNLFHFQMYKKTQKTRPDIFLMPDL